MATWSMLSRSFPEKVMCATLARETHVQRMPSVYSLAHILVGICTERSGDGDEDEGGN